MRETDLYPPVKALLESQGYVVKGEIGDCDVVAARGDDPPVIVELKQRITLDLILQGVERQKISDLVYLAVPPFGGRTARRRQREVLGLCRRLGLGLMTVTLPPAAGVSVLLDPAPYQPRKSPRRQQRLLGEFQRRVGDPSAGGSARGRPGMTAYRQDALRCAAYLDQYGTGKPSIIAAETGVTKARAILYRDVYGWFERIGTGLYQITPKGREGLKTYADIVAELQANANEPEI